MTLANALIGIICGYSFGSISNIKHKYISVLLKIMYKDT